MKRKSCPPKPTRLAVVLVSMFMLLMAACSEKDFPFNNPLGSDIYGVWYADYQASGTIGSDNTPYSRVVQAVKFNPDGTGTWWKMMFAADDASKPLALLGGLYPEDGTFDYSVAADGTITAKRRGEKQLDGSPMTLTFHFADGVLTTQDGGATQALAVAPKDYDNVLLALENSMGGASADNYNINDAEITADNWRQQEAIYIYDGVGADVKDEKGRTGYTLVNLPWYKGDKLTNLPDGFCDDVTPEMGWEWVINRCGNRSIVGNNFFAVYNKYTGILRFFYYLPQGFSTGNDHVWQVSMTDNLATRSTIPYGVPNDRTVSNKGAITQDASGTYMEYVTPWTDYHSQDGLIVPNAGWWAFDVDLSLTRPETISNDDNIKLQMRSWNTQHTSLYSTMSANIDGTMKGTFEGKTPVQVSSSKGFFGKVGEFIKIGSQVKDVFASYKEGNYAGAIKGGIGLAKSGINLASGKPKTTGGDPMIDGSFEGTLNMMMQGSINTEGVISGSQPTVGIASPTLYLKDFDTKNSHVGQGVWNLKKTPVVYATGSWSSVHDFIEEKYRFNGESKEWLIDAATWTFFDPSSIEVELNPNVFPEDEIEWMQVDAISGVRKSVPFKGNDPWRLAIGLDALAEKTFNVSTFSNEYGKEINDYVFNFVGAGDFDGKTIDGLKYQQVFNLGKTGYSMDCKVEYDYGKHNKSYTLEGEMNVFGAGNADYIIEPGYTFWRDGSLNMELDNGTWFRDEPFASYQSNNPEIKLYGNALRIPPIEINVTVTVKLKSVDQPFILNRIYLPDINYFSFFADNKRLPQEVGDKILNIIDNIQSKKNLSPKTKGHTQSYDFQAARINKCFKLLTGYSR